MSGEQWGEAVDAAALAMYGVEHLAERYRSVAEAAIAAAAPLIVADTRRQIAEELRAEVERHKADGKPTLVVGYGHAARWLDATSAQGGNGDSEATP